MTMISRHWTETQVARGTTRPAAFRRLWPRASCWIIAIAKQVFPVIAVCAVFAGVLAATIALRLAIWLPAFYRQ
jgi:hypothetical protein